MKNILVVANDAKLSEIIENSLGNQDALAKVDLNEGVQVSHFKSHTEALEHLADKFGQVNLGKIDNAIVFVDLMLEEMDGLSVVEKIRNQYHQIGIAAFVCKQNSSGPLEDLQLRSQAEAGGADLVLLAPFNLREIGSSVARLFAKNNEGLSDSHVPGGEISVSAGTHASETAQAVNQ